MCESVKDKCLFEQSSLLKAAADQSSVTDFRNISVMFFVTLQEKRRLRKKYRQEKMKI